MRNPLAFIIGLAAILVASAAAAQTPAADCKSAATVAASAYSKWSGHDSAHPVIVYDSLVTNVGGAWDEINEDQFIAPCNGTFVFAVQYVRTRRFSREPAPPRARRTTSS